MNRIQTEKIKLWGIVQGVGFRPFVAKLADAWGMKGEVLNIGGLVEIVLTDTKERISAFVRALQEEKPEPAEIVHVKREILSGTRKFDRFTILNSDEGDDEAAILPADLSVCPQCLSELQDADNPRYRHPFISCMACGPRYTIIDKIPYDRENTAMIEFPMCGFCEGEYTDRSDRRYHAQTISCHDCGPVMQYRLSDPEAFARYQALWAENGRSSGGQNPEALKIAGQSDFPIGLAAFLIGEGRVIAMKGVGGYNLLCSPFCDRAVAALREIKGREQKPFAVMFRDMELLSSFCGVSRAEEKLLASSAKPILLLERKAIGEFLQLRGGLLPADASFADLEKSRFIGSFLPSMGAQYLLLDTCGIPLIVTSANLSDMPMIRDDKEMLLMMEQKPLIAAVFYNERDIRVRMDDSVARVIDGQPQMIRRSKGYAPVPLYISRDEAAGEGKSRMILATGGQLKNSFCLSKGPFAYVSQYFGDLDSAENQRLYEEQVERMKTLFRIEPGLVVCDLHPNYFTSGFGRSYAQSRGIPLLKVQHHHAHVASVLAEHHLEGTVIGVSFDGTGYGTDGAIWGGEFLLCRGGEFRRIAHLRYVKMLGGDSSMKEAWKSALCYEYAWQAEGGCPQADGQTEESPRELLLPLSDILAYYGEQAALGGGCAAMEQNRKLVYAALSHRVNAFASSSMGRLFDAVSALLGIKDVNEYEGQCAILLEDAAARAQLHPGFSRADDLALAFHKSVAEMVLETCETAREREPDLRESPDAVKVALTGGVFQNKILMEESLRLLRRAGFAVYYNVSVSPNDGGIALGQAYIGMKRSF